MNSFSTSPNLVSKLENKSVSEFDTSAVIKANKSSNSDYSKRNSNNMGDALKEDNKQASLTNMYKFGKGSSTTGSKFIKSGSRQSGLKGERRKKAVFRKNFLDVVYVESYKKYNVDMSTDQQEENQIVRCKCVIF